MPYNYITNAICAFHVIATFCRRWPVEAGGFFRLRIRQDFILVNSSYYYYFFFMR